LLRQYFFSVEIFVWRQLAKIFKHRILRLAFCFSLLATLWTAIRVDAVELSGIRQRGYLVVGVKDNLRPLGFKNAAGQLEGLEIDLAHWLAQSLLGDSEAVQFQPVANRDRLNALLEGKVDLVIAHLGLTESRARLVDFSDPYFIDGTAFITDNKEIQAIQQLQGQQIAVLNGSDTIATVRSLIPSVQLVGADSYEQAKTAIEQGRVTAFAADLTVLTGWVQEYPQYHLLPTLLSAEALAVAMPKGLQFAELRQQVNQSIAQWQATGRLRGRVLYWSLPADGVPSLHTSQTTRMP
jgi:polar amino acid transport system substrate-binding protein